jgi:hypothetical protein
MQGADGKTVQKISGGYKGHGRKNGVEVNSETKAAECKDCGKKTAALEELDGACEKIAAVVAVPDAVPSRGPGWGTTTAVATKGAGWGGHGSQSDLMS